MSRDDPALLAGVLTEEVVRLLRDPAPGSEAWRKVAGTAEDLARLARAREAACKRQERLDAKVEAAKSCPSFPCSSS